MDGAGTGCGRLYPFAQRLDAAEDWRLVVIAYDTNILIYVFEGGGPWEKAAQEMVTRGEQEGAVLSVLAWQELVTGATLQGAAREAYMVEALSKLGATKFAPVTMAICRRAVGLTGTYGKRLYGYDAIHLATALENGAETFITNDKALLGAGVREIEIRGL